LPAFISAGELRDYLDTALTDKRYATARLESNIRAASSFLERESARQFEVQAGVTKTFTTHGRAQLSIPDLRVATTVTKSDSALTADSGYYLMPDRHEQTIFTAIQFRTYQSRLDGPSYLHQSDWWDRGLDSGIEAGRSWASTPNDLTILGDWGWLLAPDELLMACKALAGFYTVRPDSILSGSSVSADGTFRDYSNLPIEVQDFMRDWTLGSQMVAV